MHNQYCFEVNNISDIMASIVDDVLYIVIGLILLVVAWTIYATVNTDVIPAGSVSMITLALFIAAAGLTVKGAFGLVRG